jgi:hypothetical protein
VRGAEQAAILVRVAWPGRVQAQLGEVQGGQDVSRAETLQEVAFPDARDHAEDLPSDLGCVRRDGGGARCGPDR